jgi:FlaA1/EpsC-like NDP-sugar epimerase
VRLETVLGSVCDEALMEEVCRAHRVQTIYHAAAYKHVPIV